MRLVVRSRTSTTQLQMLLEQGAEKFGTRVALEKLARLDDTLDHFLAVHPDAKPAQPEIGLRVYPITGTPFVVIYDFDADEERVHFIFHRAAGLCDLDPASVEW